MTNRSKPLDLLSSILNSYQLQARIYATPSVCGEWRFGGGGAREPRGASFHLLGRGQGWLHMRMLAAPLALRAGDLIVLPRNDWHLIASDPDPAAFDNRLEQTGDGPVSSFLCGSIEVVAGSRNPILSTLPNVIVVPAERAGARLEALARLMAAESEQAAFGHEIALNKLADVLFVLAVRHHIETGRDRRGLLAALADRRLARALEAMHSRPDRRWTVATLAQRAGMSRTAFAVAFSEVMGQSPIEYLTHWRMQDAERLLLTQSITVAALAERFGYRTETAFRRAFKRVIGVPPGQVGKR